MRGYVSLGEIFGAMYGPDNRAIPMASFFFVSILGTVAVRLIGSKVTESVVSFMRNDLLGPTK